MEVKENIIHIPTQIIPAKTKKEYTYIASDGKEFSIKSECEKYESDLENIKIEKELDMQFIHLDFDEAELYCICTVKYLNDIDLLYKYFDRKFGSRCDTGVLYSADDFIPNRKYIVYITYYWNTDYGENEAEWNVKFLSSWIKENSDLIKNYQQKLEMILNNNDSVDK